MLGKLKHDGVKVTSHETDICKNYVRHGNSKIFPESRARKNFSLSESTKVSMANDNLSLLQEDEKYSHFQAVGSSMSQNRSGIKRPAKRESISTYNASYAGDDSPLKKNKTGSKEEFSCSVCRIECSSFVALSSHLGGTKHKKCLEDLNERIESAAYVEKYEIVADIQEGFWELSMFEPLVGLEYVTEYQKPNFDHRYFCEMCDLKTTYDGMLEHAISRQHRLRFMRTHSFDIYHKITGYPTFKNVMLPSRADKLLREHSAFLFRRLLKGKLRSCKVKQYKGEECMKLDLRDYQSPLRVHPSQHKDLPTAEKVLEDAELIQRAEQTEAKQDFTQRGMNPVESHDRLLNNPYHSGVSTGLYSRNFVESAPNEDLVNELLEVERLEKELVRSKLREERLCDLDQQERRIVAAIRKLHQSINGAGMTREEVVADDKLLMLLKSIRAEKRHLLIRYGENRGLGCKVSTPSFVERKDGDSLKNDFPDPQKPWRKDILENPENVPQPPSSKSVVNILDFKKTVEPIIEETRQKVEEKIFQALSSGTLSSLIENFQRNPGLQASLKKWELEQTLNSGNTTSHAGNSITDDAASSSSSNTKDQFGESESASSLPHLSLSARLGRAEQCDVVKHGCKHPSEEYKAKVWHGIAGGDHTDSGHCETSVGSRPQFQNLQKKSKASSGLLGSRPQFSGSSMKFQSGFH